MRMVRQAGLAALGTCAMMTAAAHAQAIDPLVLQAEREASVSATALHRSYAEHFSAPAVGSDRESGWAAGATGAVGWMSGGGLYGQLTGDFSDGRLNYRGTAFNSTTPLDFQTGLTDWALTARAGKAFPLGRAAVMPLALGGYRAWRRDLGVNQVEDYRTWFVGGGVRADVPVGDAWVLRAEADAAAMVSPRISFHYQSSYEASLGRSGIYAASLELDRALGRRIHLIAWGQAQWSGFGSSPTVQTVERGPIYEPSSRTTDLRLGLGVAYGF